MSDIYKDIYAIINSGRTSVTRDSKNNTQIKDSTSFKGLAASKIPMLTDIIDNDVKKNMSASGIKYATMDQVRSQAKRFTVDAAMSMVKGQGKSASQLRDSIYNQATNIGSENDPTMMSNVDTNIWISPYEANAMYSQKGLPEVIVNKKSKSILLNGLKIKNRLLTAKQIDQISLKMMSLDIPKILSDAVRDSLVYGGALVFPMFKKDNPITANMSLVGLLKAGIVGKNCIDYIIALDRWNTMHLPNLNPTQKDFLHPEKYYIPYLGADVHGSRCSRIITSSQAGFWGQVMTLGWGLSDFCGYAREVQNYKVAMNTLPMMIQQMSILARTINMDGVLAQEGSNIMDSLLEADTIRLSNWSPTNPITMDMLGELKVINRDFAEVPELLHLLRQDLAAAATMPEPMLFSSEKGNFSSGDDTQGNLTKQYESVKFIHKDVETQFKMLAKILIIDALGASEEIIRCLPYTEIHFDTPMIANSVEKAEIGYSLSQSYFEMVAGQMPLDKAALIMSSYGGDEMSIDSELLESLQERQKTIDDRATKKYEKEMELMDAQIESTKVNTDNAEATGGAPAGGAKTPGIKKEAHEYSKLEQAQHSTTRVGSEKRNEQLSKRKV